MTVPRPIQDNPQALLLLDTCGETGSVALVQGDAHAWGVAQEIWLQERAASSSLLQAIRTVLGGAKLRPDDLAAIGVVSGPGSFTGVRVGMAVAKGLCEAAGLRLVAVSRLDVLAAAAQQTVGIAVLRAGRDQMYVREQLPEAVATERLADLASLRDAAEGWRVVYAEEALRTALDALPRSEHVPISASSALPLVLEALRGEATELAFADANYVRDERTIYRRQLGDERAP